MPTFPGGLSSLSTSKADGTVTATDHPTHHNDMAGEINAIEAELGTTPSAAYATVAARLTAIEAASAFVSVTDYLPSGIPTGTDDTSYFTSALTAAGAGGTVYVPKHANPYILADLPFTANGQTLMGDGGTYVAGALVGSVLKAKAAATDVLKIQGFQDCRIANIAINGNSRASHGLLYESTASLTSQSLVLERVLFFQCARGWHIGPGAGGLSQADKNTAINCRWTECNYGIYDQAINSQETILINCDLGSTYNTSVYLESGCLHMIGGQFQSPGPLVVANTSTGSPNLTSAVAVGGAPAATNGMVIAGPGIPTGTTISSGAGTGTIVMSANATATATGIIMSAGDTRGIEIQSNNTGYVKLNDVIFEGPDTDVYGGPGFWPADGLVADNVVFQGPSLNVLVNKTGARFTAKHSRFNSDFDPPATGNGFISWNQSGGLLVLEQCDFGPPVVTGAVLPTIDRRNAFKAPVRVASTANVTISGPGATVDAVTMAAGDRMLLKDQTTASQNGIYQWNGAASAASRATDSDSADKLTNSLLVTVDEGTVNADTVWTLSTNKPITIGSTALRFLRLSPGYNFATRDPWSVGGNEIAATMDRNDVTNLIPQTVITAITSFHGGMVVPAGRLITNINAFCTAAGSGAVTTFWWALVRQSDRVVLQRTANSTTLPTVDVVHTRALQAAITLDYDTPCYIALGTQVATTSPSFAGVTGLATSNFAAPILAGNSSTAPTSTPPTVGAVLGAPAAGNAGKIRAWLS